jgi:hypothetical protein
VALPFTFKRIFKAKEELWQKLKYFTMQKYINLQINPLKKTQNPSRYHNSRTNLSSFNTSQNIISQKSSYKNRPSIIT